MVLSPITESYMYLRLSPFNLLDLGCKNSIGYTLGFVFDGHKVYEDLEKNAISGTSNLSTLCVYDDPVIETFVQSTGSDQLVR